MMLGRDENGQSAQTQCVYACTSPTLDLTAQGMGMGLFPPCKFRQKFRPCSHKNKKFPVCNCLSDDKYQGKVLIQNRKKIIFVQ